MKTKLFTAISSLFMLILMMQGNVFGQADIVDIPQVYDGSAAGAINRFISGDTTSTGARNNPDRIYRLARNKVYLMDAILIADYKLTIIGADQTDPNDGSKPPIVMPAILADGKSPDMLFQVTKDAVFKNFAGFGHTPDKNTAIQKFVQIQADGVRLELKGMDFEGFKDQIVFNSGKDCKIFMEDVYARRIHGVSPFSGAFLWNNVNSDTTIIRNCTIANGGAYFIVQRNPSNYTLIDHNTLVNTLVNPFFTPMVHNFYITNNIFKNMHIYAQNKREDKEGWFDWDGIPSSLISTDTIDIRWADTLGYKNETRTFVVENNAYFWEQKVRDLWSTILPYTGSDPSWPANDTLIAVDFMNSRTQAFFDNDAQFPNMIEKDNYNVDPGFTNASEENVDRYIDFVKHWRAIHNDYLANGFFTVDGDGDEALMQYPFPEDYTYSNATLLTGGTDGFPVGDLNWYPEKKALWLGVERIDNVLPETFSLSQNYPNPFNPTTMISYDIPKSSVVKLEVFNILGQKIATLVNGFQQAGKYKVDFNASHYATGVYIYRLSSNEFSITKKMLLVK